MASRSAERGVPNGAAHMGVGGGVGSVGVVQGEMVPCNRKDWKAGENSDLDLVYGVE